MTSFASRIPLTTSLIAAAALLLPTVAAAHTGHGDTLGFMQGVAHPIGGADHFLAMVAIGLWASQMGGRALWLLPTTFVASMGFGGLLGAMGLGLPLVEQGIMLSMLVLGCLIAKAARLPLAGSMAIAGVFAIFHGYAHGAEMPSEAVGTSYGMGFMLATSLLHAAGIGSATIIRTTGFAHLLRVTGGAIAMSGVYLCVGA